MARSGIGCIHLGVSRIDLLIGCIHFFWALAKGRLAVDILY